MNPRERMLAIAVAVIVGGLGLRWFVSERILAPIDAKEAEVAALEQQVQQKTGEYDAIQRSLAELTEWRDRALPADTAVAQTLYQEYLTKLLASAGFEKTTVSSSPPQPL